MNPITKLEIYGVVAAMLMLAMVGAYFKGHSAGAQSVQVQFDEFKNDVRAAGLKAEQDKIAREKADNDKINSAVTNRDAALARLREQTSRARSGFLSNSSGTAADSGKICYDRPTLDAALRALDSGVSRLAAEGDKAMIDGLTLLSAWPQSTPATSGKPK